MNSKSALLAGALFAVAALSGCTTAEGQGHASLYIKDAPTDEFAELHVVIQEGRIHYAGNGAEDVDEGNETEGGNATKSGWITLYRNETGIDIDLLATADAAAAAFLGEAELKSGKYTQIRLILLEAYGIDHDGARIPITVSSGTLKIPKSFTIEADKESRIIVDLDLNKSLKQTGNGNWRMTPIVGRTIVEIVESNESGADVHEEGEIADVAA